MPCTGRGACSVGRRSSASSEPASARVPSSLGRRSIEACVGALVLRLGRWPLALEFASAGLRSALGAMYVHGGIGRWKRRFGIGEEPNEGGSGGHKYWTEEGVLGQLIDFCGDRDVCRLHASSSGRGREASTGRPAGSAEWRAGNACWACALHDRLGPRHQLTPDDGCSAPWCEMSAIGIVCAAR